MDSGLVVALQIKHKQMINRLSKSRMEDASSRAGRGVSLMFTFLVVYMAGPTLRVVSITRTQCVQRHGRGHCSRQSRRTRNSPTQREIRRLERSANQNHKPLGPSTKCAPGDKSQGVFRAWATPAPLRQNQPMIATARRIAILNWRSENSYLFIAHHSMGGTRFDLPSNLSESVILTSMSYTG